MSKKKTICVRPAMSSILSKIIDVAKYLIVRGNPKGYFEEGLSFAKNFTKTHLEKKI